MAKSKETIISEIDAHLGKSTAKYYKNFYVGITNDTDVRLHGFHNVPRENHWFIWRPCNSHNVAREIEDHYINLGMDGGSGGGNEGSIIVYVYEISSVTIER